MMSSTCLLASGDTYLLRIQIKYKEIIGEILSTQSCYQYITTSVWNIFQWHFSQQSNCLFIDNNIAL